MSNSVEPADVLIVGGGSAGAVLAARLSENPARRVVLLEAGPDYGPTRFPAALLDADRIADLDHDWGYTARGGRLSPEVAAQRGKVIGGSSAVNVGAAHRARARDFAGWAEQGVDDWAFTDVLPYFRALENTPTGHDEFHGRSGPMPVRQLTGADLTAAHSAFIDAAVAYGHKRIADFNGSEQDGVGAFAVNVVDGVRHNSALVYLTAEVRARPNLLVRGGVTVDRVLFRGTKATGVVTADGAVHHADDVILSAGAYGSAAILLRSGIGPAADLTSLGIEPRADLPVGQHLQDHPFFHTIYTLVPGRTQTSPALGALLWTASSEATDGDLDLNIVAVHPNGAPFMPTGGIFALSTALVLPDAHGTLRLVGRDPMTQPVIDHNFLGTDRDRRRMLEGVRLARELARHPALTPSLADLLIPHELPDDATQLTRVIESGLAIYGHATSTAPMGTADSPRAVVDSRGAVHGFAALRVVDASIIPSSPSSVTNLTTIMLAERIADLVYTR
ncbi:GMC family oxidoreductase [Nocardia arizonensis]|uniref:GMC family oxidoreductase n=1 Tax=Nocardia arizonensis TaxID=1141647 RepID=UPI0006D26904|nr:GMC family oxidoreductase N-terminal domain-containing protein [Nocardia arizonensis]